MAIQYAGGTIISATLTQSAGTRAELAQWIRDQLVAAGWTSSGSATDYQLTSATTVGGALAGRVRVYDSGAGSCARLKFSNSSGIKTQTGDLFLLPAASKVWRIIANKHQFFVFTPGSSAAREFAMGCVPYIPTFLQGVTNECLFGWGNASSDTDVSFRVSPRYRLSMGALSNAVPPNWFSLRNGSFWEFSNGTGITHSIGWPQFTLGASFFQGSGGGNCRVWDDDSIAVVEPLIGWGIAGSTDQAKIKGQLWDAVIVADSFVGDSTITLDSRTYYAVTNSNAGAGGSDAPGTLFVAVN